MFLNKVVNVATVTNWSILIKHSLFLLIFKFNSANL